MPPPLSFEGRTSRLPYTLGSLAVLFSQYAAVYVVAKAQGPEGALDWWLTGLSPLRAAVTYSATSDALLIAVLAHFLIAAWVLAALAFRRAADSGMSEWIALLAIVPTLQIAAIVILSVVPSQGTAQSAPANPVAAAPLMRAATALGLLTGTGLTLFAVAVGALLFGAYGYGMFVLSPFLIGAMTAYIANRDTDLGGGDTALLVVCATALGSVALVTAALEGVVCIVIAAPLGIGAALVGGLFGRATALSTKRSATLSLSSLALLPLVFGLEAAFPAMTRFDTHQTIAINAPPDAVWKAIVHMGAMDEPLPLPSRLGIAYPLRGDVVGQGVGATRVSEFSTGTTVERVTEWIPERKLAFVVLQDIPAMQELSPYQNVHAPHVVGYFRTMDASFELVPRSDGGTDLIERTSHELRLEPALYWLPIARWAVCANNDRVLAHIRNRSEQASNR